VHYCIFLRRTNSRHGCVTLRQKSNTFLGRPWS
jgi:hypothetical protein